MDLTKICEVENMIKVDSSGAENTVLSSELQ